MESQNARDNGWVPSEWGFPQFMAVLIAIIVLLSLFFLFTPGQDCPRCVRIFQFLGACSCVGPPPSGGKAPDEALAECNRQLTSQPFRIPPNSAHERYLIDRRPSSGVIKNPAYFYVRLLSHSSGYGRSVVANQNLFVVAHRPNDNDPFRNLEVACEPVQETTLPSSGGTVSSERKYEAFCQLTQYQLAAQEAEIGMLRYRVAIQNKSDETLDYCFVASCDVRYPAGRRCEFPAPGSQTASVSGD